MNKAVDKASRFLMIVSCVIFGVVVLVIIANIIGRKFLNLPVKGATELVQYGVMLAVGLVMARTGYERRHIVVPILIEKFGRVGYNIFLAFGMLCGIFVFGVLGYLFITEIPAYIGIEGRTTEAWLIPYYAIYAIMGLGFVIATLEFFYEFGFYIARVFRKAEPESTAERNDF